LAAGDGDVTLKDLISHVLREDSSEKGKLKRSTVATTAKNDEDSDLEDLVEFDMPRMRSSTPSASTSSSDELRQQYDAYHQQLLRHHEARDLTSMSVVYAAMMEHLGGVDRIGFHILMDAAARAQASDFMSELVDAYAEANHPLDVEFYSLLAKYSSLGGDSDAVWGTITAMRKAGVAPTPTIFLSYISCCLNAKEFEKAFEGYNYMKRVGVEPTAATFTVLLDHCFNAGEYEKAYYVFNTMLNTYTFRPSQELYSLALCGFADANAVTDMRHCYNVMRSRRHHRVYPTSQAFTAVFNRYVMNGLRDDAREVAKDMEAAGVLDRGDIDRAEVKEILEGMPEGGPVDLGIGLAPVE
jgi:pentatricopeptide repeat protein